MIGAERQARYRRAVKIVEPGERISGRTSNTELAINKIESCACTHNFTKIKNGLPSPYEGIAREC